MLVYIWYLHSAIQYYWKTYWTRHNDPSFTSCHYPGEKKKSHQLAI